MKTRLPNALLCAAGGVLTAACGGGGATTDATSPAGVAMLDARARAQAVAPAADPALAGEVLLKLNRSADLPALLAQYGLSVVSQFGTRPIYRLRTSSGTGDGEALATRLRADPRVQYADPNYVYETPESRRRRIWAIGGDAGTYATQWNTRALRLAEAHAVTTGTGITVAVLDTGVDDQHPALAGRLVPGFDFVDTDNLPREEGSVGDWGYGHGTHVASLAAQVAPGAQIMPIRVLDAQGAGNIWVLAEGLLYAIDPDGDPDTDDGAQVINLSLGTTRETELLSDIVGIVTCGDDDDDDDDDEDDDDEDEDGDGDDRDASTSNDAQRCAEGGGAVVVSAAGNSGDETMHYPAAEEVTGALSVAASTEAGRLADFSTRGEWVQTAAPGEHVYGAVPGGVYGVWSGTSMAAPMAAGVAALLRSVNPEWLPGDVTRRLVLSGVPLCATGELKQIDAASALGLTSAPDRLCP